jgi:hypothetical protein
VKKEPTDKDLEEIINSKIKDHFLENGLILINQKVKFSPAVDACFTDGGLLDAREIPAKVEVALTFAVSSSEGFGGPD